MFLSMDIQRPATLRGGCECGRNRYVVHIPKEPSRASDVARVLFDSHPAQRKLSRIEHPRNKHGRQQVPARPVADKAPPHGLGMAQTSPLAAFLRVPLDWYHSTTFAFFPDETSAMIRKVYISPRKGHSMRHFCGFCGTPLSYWSEQPRSEADFIQVALGSLCSENLHDLEDLGLAPDVDDEVGETVPTTPQDTEMVVSPSNEVMVRDGVGRRETAGGLPWFETLISGSKLGNMQTAKGISQSRDGSVRVEWEVYEWTDEDGTAGGKRKYAELSSAPDRARMEDLQ